MTLVPCVTHRDVCVYAQLVVRGNSSIVVNRAPLGGQLVCACMLLACMRHSACGSNAGFADLASEPVFELKAGSEAAAMLAGRL